MFHAAEIGLRERDFTGKRVMIIGGGQSGADIFINALQHKWGKPQSLDWLSRRSNYQPLDEAAFTNEFFTPDYVDAFVNLSPEVKQQEVTNQSSPQMASRKSLADDLSRTLPPIRCAERRQMGSTTTTPHTYSDEFSG